MRISFARDVLVAAIVIHGTFVPAVARAASAESRALAKRELSQARDAKKAGNLAEACQHLSEVERLDPKLPTSMELAECTEALGRLVEAQALWASARDRAKHDEKPQSRARAESRRAAVEKRIAHLTLQLAPEARAGVEVLRDDTPLESEQIGSAMAMDPGEHSIVVKLAGHDDAKYPLKLGDGEEQTLAIAPGPASAVAVSPPAPEPPAPLLKPTPPAPTPPRVAARPTVPGFWTSSRTAGAIVGAIGIAGVAGGSVLCVTSDSGTDDPKLALGGASLAVGGVLLVSGLVMLATSSDDESAQQAQLRVAPSFVFGPGGTLLGASGRF